jgi:hypothetical protein
MKRSRGAVASLCLTLFLSPLAVPLQAWAASSNTAASVTNNTTTATPIGTVEASGTILINGRAAQGKNDIWDGELLQAAPGARASVRLEALGQLTLAGGSLVRVATAATAGENARRTLIASVYNGQVELELKPAAGAYLEAAGKAWLASGNAKLSLGVRDGAATLKTAQGHVGELGSFALRLPNLQGAKTAQPTAKLDVKAAERDSLLRSIKLVTNRGGGELAQPVKLYANTKAGMIGMIDSSGTVKINGRDARRQELLWDGEIVQAPANTAAQVSLAGLGQVQLAKGSVVKLTTANATANGDRRVLAASVLQGEINVKLQPEIAAYVEANGKAFSAEAGSRFRLNGRESPAIVEVFQGNVREIGSWMVELSTTVMDQAAQLNAAPRQYNIRPLAEGSQPASYLMNVRPHSTQQLRFLVTDIAGKPTAGVPVVFTLNAADGQPVGMLGTGTKAGKYFEATSDTRGVAVVPFNAGSATGSTSLSAAVRGTNSANANVVVVDDDDDFWTKRNAIPVFAAAGAAIVAGIVVALTREDRLPIKGTGPTQIVP